MIQLTRKADVSTQTFSIDIWNNFVNKDVLYTPLGVITSQQSRYQFKTIFGYLDVTPGKGIDWTNKERYVDISVYMLTSLGATSLGAWFFGDENRPFGFWDITIYENTANLNQDTTGLNAVYNGLINISSDVKEVTYEKYNDNDTDNSSVYITAG